MSIDTCGIDLTLFDAAILLHNATNQGQPEKDMSRVAKFRRPKNK